MDYRFSKLHFILLQARHLKPMSVSMAIVTVTAMVTAKPIGQGGVT